MAKKDPMGIILKNSNGDYVKAKFTLNNPDDEYSVNSIDQEQVNNFGNGNVPGVKTKVKLDIMGGTPGPEFSHTFDLDNTLTLNDSDKQFLDIGIYVWDNNTQEYKRKGGTIVRTGDADDL